MLAENRNRIFRICCWYFEDADERNDVFQESLIRIWEQLHSFRGQSKISTWVFRVVVNTCLTWLRSDKRRKTIIESGRSIETLQMVDSSPADPDQFAEEKLSFFHRFLETLNLADRTLVSLYLEEQSTKEMAEITGLSEANVRVKIFRIREQIKKEWEDKQNGIR